MRILKKKEKTLWIKAAHVLIAMSFIFGIFSFYISNVYSGEGGTEGLANCSDAEDNDSDTYTDLDDSECMIPPGTPDLLVGSDSGASDTDNITNDVLPDFLVTCNGTYAVRLKIDGSLVSSETCTGGEANFSNVSSLSLNGTYIITATQYSVSAGESAPSGGISVVIDTTADTPGTPDLEAESDSGFSSTDNLTNASPASFDISCTTGNTVELLLDGGSVTSGTCAGSSISLSDGISVPGPHSVSSRQTDLAGNVADATDPLSVEIDREPPADAPGIPDMTSASDTGSSNIDDITYAFTPIFSISCTENGSERVYLREAGSDLGSAQCAGTVEITSSSLGDGPHDVYAVQVDEAGNESSPSNTIEIHVDTTAPTTSGAPNMTPETDSGSSNSDNITNYNTPDFTGSCTDGNTVQLFDDGVSTGLPGVCGVSAVFSRTTGTLASGSNSITFKETDVAGNISTASTALVVIIDTTVPVFSSVTPATSATIINVTSSSDIAYTASEALGSGSITITRTSGTADASSPRTCTLTGTALASGAHTLNLSDTTNGCTSDVSDLVSGTVYTFVFAGSDVAGNSATSITRTSVTFDNTLPTITNVSSDKSAGSYTVGEIIDIDVTFSEAVTSTGDVTVTLETGTTDRTCTFTVSGATTGTCNYTVQSGDTSSDLTVGSISGTVADAAGNAMSNFTPTTNLAANETLVIDTTAPVISEVTAVTTPTSVPTPDYVFTSSEAGTITYGGSCSSLTTAASSGSNTITLVSLADGTYSDCTIIVTDAPGNVSSTLTMTSFTVATAVPETPSSDSGGSLSGSRASNRTVTAPTPTPLNTFIDTITNFIPSFLKPDEPIEPEEVTVVPITPEEPQLSLEGDWNLIPNSVISEFVLGDLPSEITDLIFKFPQIGKVFSSVGVVNISDLSKLQDVTFNLPKIVDRSNPPTEVLFAKTGEGQIDVSSSLNISENGIVEQKIHTLGGKPIILQIKPEGKAESVKGYLTFKRKAEVSVMNVPTNSLLASAMIATGSLGEKKQVSTVKPELLIFAFEYTDPDGDGIYTANIQTPQVEGEYEVITIINYTDKKQGAKELRMVTVIDPEGYVYEKDSMGREVRIDDAKVSIFEINSDGESLWDAKKYSQDNPQITDKTGKYAFLVPEGSYFITVESSGHDLYKGEPFIVKEGNPVHENIELINKHGWLYNLMDWKVGAGLIILSIYVTRSIYRRKKII